MNKPPGFVLFLWPLVDSLLCRYYHIRPLGEGSGIMAVEVRQYKKNTLTLTDSSEIKAGDTILELHMNNNWFKERRKFNLTTSQLVQQIFASLVKDLSILTKKIDDGIFGDIAALHGCTHLGSGARHLGFQVKELPNTTWKQWAQFYLAGLVQVYDPRRNEVSRSNRPLELKEIWLSKSELSRRYGSKHHTP
jgi:hypothetical protein